MRNFTCAELREIWKMAGLCGDPVDGGYPDQWVVVGRKIVRASTADNTNESTLQVLSLTALRAEYRGRKTWGGE